MCGRCWSWSNYYRGPYPEPHDTFWILAVFGTIFILFLNVSKSTFRKTKTIISNRQTRDHKAPSNEPNCTILQHEWLFIGQGHSHRDVDWLWWLNMLLVSSSEAKNLMDHLDRSYLQVDSGFDTDFFATCTYLICRMIISKFQSFEQIWLSIRNFIQHISIKLLIISQQQVFQRG